jgi:hypothetical protein
MPVVRAAAGLDGAEEEEEEEEPTRGSPRSLVAAVS